MTHRIRKSEEISCFEVLDVLFWGAEGTKYLHILLGAHELRARRTMCKSVFFFQRYEL
jgi:hypothetical protein